MAFSTKHYSQALQILADKTSQPSIFSMLVSSLLLISFETVRKNPKAANWHLHHALRVSQQWKRLFKSITRGFSPEDRLVDSYLEPTFAHLEANLMLSSISSKPRISDLNYLAPIIPERFQSLFEARGKMIELWVHFLSQNPPSTISPEQQLQVFPTWSQWYEALLQLMNDMSSWRLRDRLLAQLLCAHYKIMNIGLLCQHSPSEKGWDDHLEGFRELLATCYDVCHGQDVYQINEKDPNDLDFGISPGVLPPLWLIGMVCRDPMVRRRAVELLRTHHRQCGHSDACSAVVSVEAMIALEEEGIVIARSCNDIPESQRVRILESDLTNPGKMVLTFTRSPYTEHDTIEVPYTSSHPLPVRKYTLWPISASMAFIGYGGFVRPRASSCVCKIYGTFSFDQKDLSDT